MSIIRLIYVRVAPEEVEHAETIWKKECAPLMIQQKGCISEKLLRAEDEPGAYISYSEWETEQDVENYRNSEAHREIVAHARALKGAQADVKLYRLVN
jgi:heme-degrading monooxygenase HmoA